MINFVIKHIFDLKAFDLKYATCFEYLRKQLIKYFAYPGIILVDKVKVHIF